MTEHSHHNPSHLEVRLGGRSGEIHETPDRVEGHEAAPGAEFAERSLEYGETFTSANAELLEGMKQGETQIQQLIESGQDILKHFVYSGADKEQTAQQLRDIILHVKTMADHQAEGLDEQLRRDADTFLSSVSDTVAEAARMAHEHSIDDQARHVVRATESVAEEIRGAVRLMDYGRDERDASVSHLLRLTDELEHDRWGAETIAAQLKKGLGDLEDAGGYEIRGLMRIEAELENLQRLRQL